MGLAASQARYLDLTARKSNIEFQGQMVNQQRTELANESAGIFAEMLTIDPPVTPTQSEFKDTAYTFSGSSSSSESAYKMYKWEKIEGETYEGNNGKYNVTIEYRDKNSDSSNPTYSSLIGTANLAFDATDTDMVKKITMLSCSMGDENIYNDIGEGIERTTSVSSRIDTDKYQAEMEKYEYEYAQYQKKMSELQARTQKIQVQDRTLELQLRQLDTEQEALQTEMESVKKVIEKSVDQIFKTFQS